MKHMNRYLFAAIFFCLISTSSLIFAQQKIIFAIDTSFAHGGKLELSLSGFGDEAVDFYGLFPDQLLQNKITVCAKLGMANPSLKQFGLFRLNPDGTYDNSFGNGGKVMMNWGISDFPTGLLVSTDLSANIILPGMSATTARSEDHLPAVFKFTKNGKPDFSFGGDGHVTGRFDDASGGIFTNVYFEDSAYLAVGGINDVLSYKGFYAMRFFAKDGKIDSAFGNNGRAFLPYRLHNIYGFLTQDETITFIGESTPVDSDPPRAISIILGRMKQNGTPDSTFGKNGILETGVVFSEFNGSSMVAAMQPDNKIIAALPPNGVSLQMPLQIVRFTTTGKIDSAYGTNGFVTAGFGPAGALPRGLNVAKNGKSTVSGSTLGNLQQCAATRRNVDGSPDLSYNQTGTAILDVDSGLASNYLTHLVGIGNKRYIGIGSSIREGINTILIARFKDDTLQTGGVAYSEDHEIKLYPNPANTMIEIESPHEFVGEAAIIDGLGRKVKSFKANNLSSGHSSCDISALDNGIYYLSAQSGKGKIIQKIIVLH
jgi:uncharacterized delta-60 repeat protein